MDFIRWICRIKDKLLIHAGNWFLHEGKGRILCPDDEPLLVLGITWLKFSVNMQPCRHIQRLSYKTNMRPFTFSLLLFLVTFTASQAQTHEIKVSSFTDINVFGPFKVKLIKALNCRVEIDYNGIEASDVIAKCNNDELQIKIRNKGFFDFMDDSDRKRDQTKATVTIYYTSLENIEIKGGATLRAADPIITPSLTLISQMGADVRLELQVKELELESSMGSEVELSGTADKAKIKAKMGTEVDASMLKCQEVTVSASMGADVTVFAEKELNASANFGASISCKGNPPHKHTSGFFGADVN